jgi:hypothetical protein
VRVGCVGVSSLGVARGKWSVNNLNKKIMHKDFGVFFRLVTNKKGYIFNDVLFDSVIISRLPDNKIVYTVYTIYQFNGAEYALSLDLPTENILYELFNDFFKIHLSVETLSRFSNLFLTDLFDYVNFGDYQFRFNCSATLGEPVAGEFEMYIPFVVDEYIPNS